MRARLLQAGIDARRATARTLRHTFAVDLLQNGVPIESVQYPLGHESVETTLMYLRIIGQKEEDQVYRKAWAKDDRQVEAYLKHNKR